MTVIAILLKSWLGSAWAFLKGASAWQILCLIAGCVIIYQHFELVSARHSAARWERQFNAEHAGRVADRTAYQEAQIRAAANNRADVQKIEAQQQKVTTNVETDYQTKLADLRARYERLRRQQNSTPQGSAGEPGVSQVPESPSRSDGKAGVPLSSAERLRAAENELQLDELITWVEQQEQVREPSH